MQAKYAQQAMQWLDVPYQHRGTTRRGCDCTGLLIGVARELGYLKIYQLRKYPPDWNLHGMADDYIAEQLGRLADPIAKSQADAGDIVIMHFGACISHCGILVNKQKKLIVHCYRTTGKVTKCILKNSSLASRWTGTYRLNEQKLATFS